MAGQGDLIRERAREVLAWLEEEALGREAVPLWIREVLERAFRLPGEGETMAGDPWRKRLVRQVLAAFALGDGTDVSALVPEDGRVLWEWLLSHPQREKRLLALLTDPPCDAKEQGIWLQAILCAPVLGLLELAFVGELQEVAQALREGLISLNPLDSSRSLAKSGAEPD